MYVDYYDLQSDPFRIEPDYRFFYESRQHRHALDVLSKGLSTGDGICVITGEKGVGKTTLLDFVNANLEPSHFVNARIVATGLEPDDLLPELARQFDIGVTESTEAKISQRLEAFLKECDLAQRRAILLIDESQDLAPGCLEILLRLSNLHAGDRRGVHIAFFGGLQTKRILDSGDVARLRLNVVQSCQLLPLEIEDTRGLIMHRLRRVGWLGDPGFAEGAIELIQLRTGGLPRRVIQLCESLFQHCCRNRLHRIGGDVVSRVGLEMQREWLKANRIAPVVKAAAASVAMQTPRPEGPAAPPAVRPVQVSSVRPDRDRAPRRRNNVVMLASAVLGVAAIAFLAWSLGPLLFGGSAPDDARLASTVDTHEPGTSRKVRGRIATGSGAGSPDRAEPEQPDTGPATGAASSDVQAAVAAPQRQKSHVQENGNTAEVVQEPADPASTRPQKTAAAADTAVLPAAPPAPALPVLEADTPSKSGRLLRPSATRNPDARQPVEPAAAKADAGSLLGTAAAREVPGTEPPAGAFETPVEAFAVDPVLSLVDQFGYLPSPADSQPDKLTITVASDPDPKAATAVADPKSTLSVVDLVLTHGVVDREPLEARQVFTSAENKAIAFLRLKNSGEPSKVSVHWYVDEKLYSTVELKVGTSVRWRTWSSAQIQPGAWRVMVEDESRRLLAESAFTVE